MESQMGFKHYIIVNYIATLRGSKYKEEKVTPSGIPDCARDVSSEEGKIIHKGR